MTQSKQLYQELLENGKVLPGIMDPVFKRIMTHHKDYLGFILERFMPLTKDEIEKEGEFQNVELPTFHISMKTGRMDLLLRVQNYYINLEANGKIDQSLRIRNEAHFSWLIYNEYSKVDKKTLDEILYQVAFNRGHRLTEKLIVELKYFDKKLNVGDDHLVKVEINLENVKKKYYNKEKLDTYEKALLLLVIDSEEKILEIGKGDQMLEEVGNDIISYSRAKEIVDAYEAQMIQERYIRNSAEEEGFNRGMERGMKEGLEKGFEQGIEKGIQKGIEQEREKLIAVAKSMLDEGMKPTKISKITGLSIKQINELKNKK